MSEYKTTDYFTVISAGLTQYIKEAEEIGASLHNAFFTSVNDRTFTITVQATYNAITNVPNFYPTYIFKVMPCVGKDKEFCIDVNIQFRDAIHKFVMRWGNNK